MYEELIHCRDMFMGIEELVPLSNGKSVMGINFDNAATTPAFKSVINNIVEFSSWYSSIHRGKGYKSKICDEFYEKSRDTILKFVGASRDRYNVIFVKNTTEGINKLAYRLIDCKDVIVLSTRMEHHSNDLPWRDKCKVQYVEVDENGRLSIEHLIQKLQQGGGKIKLLTLTGASNVTGYVNDIHLIACICHSYNCKILVDGAQLVPHRRVIMDGTFENDYLDYLVFSAHKMYAPFGIGVVITPKDCFYKGEPECKGGGTVKFVTDYGVIWDDPPHKEEAGTPNVMGIVALLSAIKELSSISLDKVSLWEDELTSYLSHELKKINGIKIYGDNLNIKDRLGIITFNIEGMYHNEVAEILSEDYGISVRNGCFCAGPYVKRLLNLSDKDIEEYIKHPERGKPGMVRVSLGLYNNKREINDFLNAIEQIVRNKKI
ncbi:Selenocysteine lyase/Cysteine desulfurase [Clostridium amylolyticum]|uniref:Selenocysteine lyase/Cysteine desulfurase n=1 Tax=Clostridium amylolyticum TaxID=1121298 RepID=A0A1M6MTI9_9CLOT|nr:aminotransferase class V-fold PLP-dependent enzyme [Clostridium amylolyticum]SHJ86726.1 Selenocysteine lyase/Cysteine desulfurase [Clostridium amylolyticum]